VVKIDSGSNVTLNNSLNRNVGAVGVVISGESNGISNSHLYDLGQAGIDINGGNRKNTQRRK